MKLIHPSALSEFARYRQVRALLKQTNRASNSDWYRGPLSLDSQIHVFVSDSEFDQTVLHVGSEGVLKILTGFNPEIVNSTEQAVALIQKILEEELPKKTKSLGVIVHLADDFTLTELGSEFKELEDIKSVRESVQYNPIEVLNDRSIDPQARSWRVFPYAGTGGGVKPGVSVSINRKHQKFVQILRDAGESINFPVVVEVLSAPLVALSLIPKVISPANERAFVCIMQYTNFSVLSFFSPAGNLMQLRTMRHRGSDFPANIVTALSTMSSGLGMANATYHVLPLGGRAAAKSMMEFMFEQAAEMKPQQARMGLRVTADNKHIRPEIAAFLPEEEEEKPSFNPASKLTSAVSLTRKWVLQASGEGGIDISNSATFKGLSSEGWHLQNFLPPSLEEQEIMPSQQDVKLFNLSRNLKKLAALLVLGVAGFVGFNVYSASKNIAWTANPEPFRKEQVALQTKVDDYNYFDDIYKDRSSAWSSIELISTMLPSPAIALVDEFGYSFSEGEKKRGNNKSADNKKYSQRNWIVNGNARSSALRDLTNLNTEEGINKVFDKVADITGEESFRMSGFLDTRKIEVDIERSISAKTEDGFNVGFKIGITQKFFEGDPYYFGK